MNFKNLVTGVIALAIAPFCFSQLTWTKVDSLYGDLPTSMHVFKSTDLIEGKPNIAYYVSADLNDTMLNFTTAAENGQRITPANYYRQLNAPLLIVNGGFFNTKTGYNLNAVIKDKQPVAFNLNSVRGAGKDSTINYRIYRSAIGITENRKADVAWLKTDSISRKIVASEQVVDAKAEPIVCCNLSKSYLRKQGKSERKLARNFHNWDMQTAIGGGPVLVQKGDTLIANNEERMFGGKARYDKHPRTAMGYTSDGKIIVLVIQGRFPGVAEGADLKQEAMILKDLGCYEALNLDGGGSTCLLVNGIETIIPSDKEGQRGVPSVFVVKRK